MSYKVVVIGAGYAGVEAALTLHKKEKRRRYQITLIDKNPYHTFNRTSRGSRNRVDDETITVPLYKIFRYTDVRVIQDEIKNFDFEHKRFPQTDAVLLRLFNYCCGSSKLLWYTRHEENSLSLWSLDDAIRIRDHIRVALKLPRKRSGLRNFNNCGGWRFYRG